MATTTVRVTTATRERLRWLTARAGMTTAELLEELTARAEDELMLADFNAFFADPDAARDYHASEIEALAGTLADALQDLE
jgi:NAD(P)H-dependent FMN reductase